jgi:hypothetical protein
MIKTRQRLSSLCRVFMGGGRHSPPPNLHPSRGRDWSDEGLGRGTSLFAAYKLISSPAYVGKIGLTVETVA